MILRWRRDCSHRTGLAGVAHTTRVFSTFSPAACGTGNHPVAWEFARARGALLSTALRPAGAGDYVGGVEWASDHADWRHYLSNAVPLHPQCGARLSPLRVAILKRGLKLEQ
jgi:hypothetical protein